MSDTGQYTYHFIGGRKRYNAERQRAAAVRRHQVAALLSDGRRQCEIAKQLRVDKATISRDVMAVNALWGRQRCPFCKRWYSDFLGRPSEQCGAVGRPKRKRRGLMLFR